MTFTVWFQCATYWTICYVSTEDALGHCTTISTKVLVFCSKQERKHEKWPYLTSNPTTFAIYIPNCINVWHYMHIPHTSHFVNWKYSKSFFKICASQVIPLKTTAIEFGCKYFLAALWILLHHDVCHNVSLCCPERSGLYEYVISCFLFPGKSSNELKTLQSRSLLNVRFQYRNGLVPNHSRS